MFCDHDKDPLYGHLKGKEDAFYVRRDSGNGKNSIVKEPFRGEPSQYADLGAGLAFDNLYDAEKRAEELTEAGKKIAKDIIRGKKADAP